MAGFTACIMGPAKALTVIANLAVGTPPADTTVLNTTHVAGVSGIESGDSQACPNTQYMTIKLDDAQSQHVKNFNGTLAFRFKANAKTVPVLPFQDIVKDSATKFICDDTANATGCKLVMRVTDDLYNQINRAGGFAIR